MQRPIVRARVRGSFAFSLEQRDTGELLFSAWIATHPLPRIERSGIVRRPNTNLCRAKRRSFLTTGKIVARRDFKIEDWKI